VLVLTRLLQAGIECSFALAGSGDRVAGASVGACTDLTCLEETLSGTRTHLLLTCTTVEANVTGASLILGFTVVPDAPSVLCINTHLACDWRDQARFGLTFVVERPQKRDKLRDVLQILDTNGITDPELLVLDLTTVLLLRPNLPLCLEKLPLLLAICLGLLHAEPAFLHVSIECVLLSFLRIE